jgi:AAA+ ATPase superfamily predicted ATPase
MALRTQNPFRFGDPVQGDYFMPLPAFERIVSQFTDNRIHTVLIGPRRFGKTSFVLRLLQELESKGKPCLFADIFNITSHRDFLQQILRALRSKRGWQEKIRSWVKSIPRLRPQIAMEMDPATGLPGFSLSTDLTDDKDVKETILDVFAAIERLGDQVVVAIDEFQKIAEINDGGWLEATLRTQMQQLPNTTFLFTGSRRSVISDMLNNQTRPFYRSCQTLEFPSFGGEFIDWIIGRFALVETECDRDALLELQREVQNTPNYMQMACFHLVAMGVGRVTRDEISKVLRVMVSQNAYAYQTLLNTLTAIQQRSLRLAAKVGSQIFSKELLEKYEIPSGAALASSIRSLKDKQILDEGSARGVVVFDDPLFAIWLRFEFAD